MHQDSGLFGRYVGAALLLVPLIVASPVMFAGTVVWGLLTGGYGLALLVSPGLVVPGFALLGLLLYSWNMRFRPRRWPAAAGMSGLVCGMTIGFSTPVLALFSGMAVPVCMVGGIVVFALIAARVRRFLCTPLSPELAGTPLEVPVPGRASNRVTLYIGTEKLTVGMTGVKSRPSNNQHIESVVELAEIVSTERVELAGTEPVIPLREDLTGIPTATAGPGIRVLFGEQVWYLPSDDADTALVILRQRIAAARSPASA